MLVTTAGVLPPDPVADFAERMLHGDEAAVTVMSVIEVPRDFLEGIESETWRPFDPDESPTSDDAAARRYVEERGRRLVEPVVAALTSRGFTPETVFVEGSDPAAAIVAVASQVGADVIVMGATRKLFTESAWSSVSMKVTAESKTPVLLIPAPLRAGELVDDEAPFATNGEVVDQPSTGTA
jgi:nucleotide-binding universal stress UspA family protein